jgi:hypothetical protein
MLDLQRGSLSPNNTPITLVLNLRLYHVLQYRCDYHDRLRRHHALKPNLMHLHNFRADNRDNRLRLHSKLDAANTDKYFQLQIPTNLPFLWNEHHASQEYGPVKNKIKDKKSYRDISEGGAVPQP